MALNFVNDSVMYLQDTISTAPIITKLLKISTYSAGIFHPTISAYSGSVVIATHSRVRPQTKVVIFKPEFISFSLLNGYSRTLML